MHCKDCRWWEYSHANSTTEGLNIKKMGLCNNPKCPYAIINPSNVLPEDFGCIHFEEKEKLQAVYNLELRIDKERMNNEPDFFNMLNVFISSYGYHFKITHSCIEDLLKEDT